MFQPQWFSAEESQQLQKKTKRWRYCDSASTNANHKTTFSVTFYKTKSDLLGSDFLLRHSKKSNVTAMPYYEWSLLINNKEIRGKHIYYKHNLTFSRLKKKFTSFKSKKKSLVSILAAFQNPSNVIKSKSLALFSNNSNRGIKLGLNRLHSILLHLNSTPLLLERSAVTDRE